ncbi:MAG: hypothetical protein V9G19_08890 [Tetrasphaera sp.]
MPPHSLIVADGRKSTYGIAAILGAIEELDEAAYPVIEWPTRARPLTDLIGRAVGAGRRAVVLWLFFSTSFTSATALVAALNAGEPLAAVPGLASLDESGSFAPRRVVRSTTSMTARAFPCAPDASGRSRSPAAASMPANSARRRSSSKRASGTARSPACGNTYAAS